MQDQQKILHFFFKERSAATLSTNAFEYFMKLFKQTDCRAYLP